MKAVYLVFFKISEKKTIEIGALGEIRFEPGTYIYTGSAMTNVGKRLGRHFSAEKNRHWHIDYFTSEAEPVDYFILPESSEYECVMADILNQVAEPVPGFGCSDCKCEAHFFRIS